MATIDRPSPVAMLQDHITTHRFIPKKPRKEIGSPGAHTQQSLEVTFSLSQTGSVVEAVAFVAAEGTVWAYLADGEGEDQGWC